MPLRVSPAPLYEHACHEGNYTLPLVLNGARVRERKDRCGGGVEVDRRNPEAPCATPVAASRLWRRRRGGPEYRRLDGNHDLKGQIGMRKQRGDAGERREDL